MIPRTKRLLAITAGFLLLGCAWGGFTKKTMIAHGALRQTGRPSGYSGVGNGEHAPIAALAAPKTPKEPILPVPADGDMGHAWLMAEGPKRAAEQSGRRYVTFTFDDGPGPHTTDAVLKVLKKYDVRATFFLIGTYMDGESKRADLTRAAARHIVEAGHLIGNHSYTHRHLKGLAPDFTVSEIDESSDSIARVTGVRPTLFRPPYGELDDFASSIVRQRNLQLVAWSLEAQDMLRDDPKRMEAELRGGMDYAGGGIVLLHDVKWATVRALDGLLKWLRKNPWDPAHPDQIGYEIVDLPTYYRATLAAPQPFATREALMHARADAWQRSRGEGPSHPQGSPSQGSQGMGQISVADSLDDANAETALPPSPPRAQKHGKPSTPKLHRVHARSR